MDVVVYFATRMKKKNPAGESSRAGLGYDRLFGVTFRRRFAVVAFTGAAFTGGSVFAAGAGTFAVFSACAGCAFVTAGANSFVFAGRERAPARA